MDKTHVSLVPKAATIMSTQEDSTTSSTTTPWVERYRPKNLGEVSHQNEVVQTLQNAVKTNNLPHLLLYGPPGTGKTSVALALCKELWAPSEYKRRVLELNASDERGISVVRDKIKHFATISVGSSTSTSTSSNAQKNTMDSFVKKAPSNDKQVDDDDDKEAKKYPNPPFKIIILDEADTVTPDAQAALRRIIVSTIT
jgi:replication factor C subunit 2/4